jgi:hypothetical protein
MEQQLTVAVEVHSGSTRARSSAANRDLVCQHISGVKPTQVCRATGPIFAARPAYRFRHRHRLARIDDRTGIFKNILTT